MKNDNNNSNTSIARNDFFDNNNEEENEDPANVLMNHGFILRKLREMEVLDEMERQQQQQQQEEEEEKEKDDSQQNNNSKTNDLVTEPVYTLSSGQNVLLYDTYLQHQKYYDDLKHIDYTFIDYTIIIPEVQETEICYRLIIEQDKRLGKGGFCWDAAFILGEYVISMLSSSSKTDVMNDNNTISPSSIINIIELGCGTGLCGMMIAKAITNAFVHVTDLPPLTALIQRNIIRNFDSDAIRMTNNNNNRNNDFVDDGSLIRQYYFQSTKPSSLSSDNNNNNDDNNNNDNAESAHKRARGTITASILEWGNIEQERNVGCIFDYIIGADIVASLYDPIELANTIHRLCNSQTIVYVSFKERLSSIHRIFEKEMQQLFTFMDIIIPSCSRNNNPDVRIIIAKQKKMAQC